MNMKPLVVVIGIILSLFAHSVLALGTGEKYYRVSSSDIISVFSGMTLSSINERTKDEALTYFAENGVVKQSIKSLNLERKGKWHAANNQLCLHWENKESEYCFDSILFHNDIFYLFKDGKIESSVTNGVEGDKTGF